MALAVLLAVAIPAAAVSLFLFGFRSSGPPSPPRAVIVDQLSLTFPNPDFVQVATDMLEEAGYTVDYYPGEEVTIDLFRDLPSRRYEMVILRVHAGRYREPDGTLTDDISLFTGDPYSRQKFAAERRAGILMRARYLATDPPSYFFGIPPKFIETQMKGNLEGATVILMGCDGLRSSKMAEAFVQKGAEAFISWDDKVSAAHTDKATERLLYHLLVEDRSVPEAVARAMNDVGPDPAYGARLLFYPAEASASAVP